MVKVLVVDDHALVREGLRSLLVMEPDLEVVGEAASGEEALDLASQLSPDVVLLDVRMPGLGGLDTLRALKETCPSTKVLLLTLYDVGSYVRQGLAAGAAGYLLKDSEPGLIRNAVRTAAAHGTVLHGRALDLLLSAPLAEELAGPANGGVQKTALPNLSERERQILALVAHGNSNKEIGRKLHLAESTVKKYVQTMLGKMRAADRTEAAVMGLKLGLVS